DDINPEDFRGSNGSEGNHTVNPNPDTEDLNFSTRIDNVEKNFDYTIGLCDTCRTYLVTDVRREFPRASARDGWRRYRIPIADSLRTQFGFADLTNVRQVRVWLEGVMEPDPLPKKPLLMLGGLEIVGSRWLTTALTDSEKTAGTTLTLNALNTV